MILYKLNNGQATAARGSYRNHENGQDSHDCQPVFIEDKFWILRKGIEETDNELDMRLPWQALTEFDTEDLEDPNTIIYQEWLNKPPI